MSASTGTTETGPTAQAIAAGAAPPGDLAARIFRQVTVVPTLLATAWLLAGLPLLLIGHFTPMLMLVISIPLAVVLLRVGLVGIAGRAQGLLAARGAAAARTPWWTVAALVAVAVAFGVDQLIYHSQQIIVQRDAASYIQFGNWISHHGSLPIPPEAAAFGGYSHLITFASAAFYQVGHAIVPQFMAGLPMTLSAAFWLGGISAATATGALLGSCGVLALGGLVGRLVGPRWAPLGALMLALSLPEQFTSRSTYSEPLAQLLFLGGLCLVIDSMTPEGATRRRLAGLGGVAIGLTLLVRIDGASDMLPLIPYFGLLVLGRSRLAWPLIAGVVAGSSYGAIDGLVLSRPYLDEVSGSLIPLMLGGFVLLAATFVAVLVRWDRGLPKLTTNRWPNAAAALAFVITAGFIVRPYVQTVHGLTTVKQMRTMAAMQAAQHLPIQPTRTYFELSMHWVFWYLGVPAVVLATIGAAALARRCLRGQAPVWVLPLMCFAWIIVATLLRPSIWPDQPWGSRRLVPGVLPGFIVLALWGSSWLVGRLRERGGGPVVGGTVLRGSVVAILAAALIIPAVKTTFGIAHRPGGPLGIRIVAVGLADHVTYAGEVAAVDHLCAAIPANSSVLFVDRKTGSELAQVVRGMCGDPTSIVVNPDRQRVLELIADIQRVGRRPVLLAGTPADLLGLGHAVHVMNLTSRIDGRVLERPPLHTHAAHFHVWMSEFAQ